jgi:hypothetical protein
VRERVPGVKFELDATSEWDDLVDDLAAIGAVVTLDLKGQYHGTAVDQKADPDLYRRVIEGFPDAIMIGHTDGCPRRAQIATGWRHSWRPPVSVVCVRPHPQVANA